MLKPICESPFQTVLRTNAMTSLTRMNSGKYNSFLKPSTYIPPRPIQINTADIDVSASKFDKNRNVRVRSTSPDPSKTDDKELSSTEVASGSDTAAFMPRVDQNDPPHFRSTIKRDRHIVRLSTMRRRTKSRSKSRSIEKRTSSKKSESSRKSSSSSKRSSPEDPPESVAPKENVSAAEQNVKKSWRDKFGDSLQTNAQKVTRKTPGELILEKHIIRDKKNEENAAKNLRRTVFHVTETVTPQEITYLEPMIRKSIRRQSLIKCPSFKDICNDISADLKADDDLNAGDLRRRASLILEQEEQILSKLATMTRRPSADLVNVDVPILEMDENGETDKQNESQSKDNDQVHVENVIVIKKKTKKKGGKVRHKITVSVDVDNSAEPVLVVSPNCETSVSTEKTSPKWKAVVEDIEENHTIHKVLKLPMKKADTVESAPLMKCESAEDFWKLIDRRESIHYKKRIDSKQSHIEVLEIIEQDAVAACAPSREIEQLDTAKKEVENIAESTQTESAAKHNDSNAARIQRRRSSLTVKSRSAGDIEEVQEQKKKLKARQPKVKAMKKSDAATISLHNKEQTVSKAVQKSPSGVGDFDATSAIAKPAKNSTESIASNELSSNKALNTGDNENTQPSDALKIRGPRAKGETKTAAETSAPKTSQKDSKKTKRIDSNLGKEQIDAECDESGKSHSAPKIAMEAKVEGNSTIPPSPVMSSAEKSIINKPEFRKVSEAKSTKTETLLKKTKDVVKTSKGDTTTKQTTSTESVSVNVSTAREIVGTDFAGVATSAMTADAKSSISIETVQHDVRDKDAKSIGVDANSQKLDTTTTNEPIVSLSKFATVSNLNSNDLSASGQRVANSNAINDDDYISGEETFDLLLSSDPDDDSIDDWQQESDSDRASGSEMGLKRRHRKKKDKFDPKKVVKLDHKRKCYVVDEAPKYPLIATPRPLQKKYKFYSESETESEGSDSYCGSSDGCYDECLSPNDVVVKDVIRMSTCSNDSGFEGGGTAPSSPKKMLGKQGWV